jgi:5'-nucleotidase
MRVPARLAAIVCLAFAVLWTGDVPARAGSTGLVPIKILAVNDLHGGLDTGRQVGGRSVGGAAYLAAHMRARAADHPNVFVVGAGDMVGASPPVSALLQDEPTIRVMNALGFLLNTPGNHEFDEGVDEFFRLKDGGCHPTTGCFEGSRFQQISANIVVEATGEPLLPPFHVEYVQGVPIAFIGATHTDVPNITTAGAVQGLVFPDPATEINRYVQELTAQGIRAIVVLIHEGGSYDRATGRLTGPITPIVEALDPEVDVVVSAHTHQGYATHHAGKLVTQGFSYSTAFVDIDLQVDPNTRDVADARAEVVTTYNDVVEPDPEIQAIVDEAEALVAPRISRVVGMADGSVTRNQNRAGESALGNLIADAFRWKTGTQIALTNPGGIREDIRPGEVTWGQLFSVQPFANDLVNMTLTGEQLFALFNQQWSGQPDGGERYRPLQASGIRVAWDGRRPRGDRIVSLALEDGQPIDRAGQYSVTVNSFMAGGGDGYTVLEQGTDRQTDGVDLDAFVEYVQQLSQPFGATVEGRITRVD